MHDYKIYYLSCPKTYEVRYVGATTAKMETRLQQHLYEAKKKKGTHKLHWIKSLLDENLKPLCCIVEHCNKDNWAERECYHMSLFSNLTNTREGGIGVSLGRTEEARQRIINAIKIPIVQLTKEGKFVKYWDSATDVHKELGFHKTGIGSALKYPTRMAYGYRWMYTADYYANGVPKRVERKEINKRFSTCNKGVDVFDLEGNLIYSFDSQTECTNFFQFPFCSVVNASIKKNYVVQDKYIFKNKGDSFSKNKPFYKVENTGETFSKLSNLAKYLKLSSQSVCAHFREHDKFEIQDKTIVKY